MAEISFVFGIIGIGLAVFVYIRLDRVEKKLVELGALPKEFDSRKWFGSSALQSHALRL